MISKQYCSAPRLSASASDDSSCTDSQRWNNIATGVSNIFYADSLHDQRRLLLRWAMFKASIIWWPSTHPSSIELMGDPARVPLHFFRLFVLARDQCNSPATRFIAIRWQIFQRVIFQSPLIIIANWRWPTLFERFNGSEFGRSDPGFLSRHDITPWPTKIQGHVLFIFRVQIMIDTLTLQYQLVTSLLLYLPVF